MKLSMFLVGIVGIVIVIVLVNFYFIQTPTPEISEESKAKKCELYMEGTPEVIEFPCEVADIVGVDCEMYCEGLCNTSSENLNQECLEWDIVNKNVSV